MTYHQFINEDGEEYGSFEVFYHAEHEHSIDDEGNVYPSGWYWYPCFPGCMPDGEPNGPYDTEEEALKDARNER